MADDIAVRLVNISKMYRLFPTKGDRLREALSPFRRKYHREFWALKNVTLDIPKGRTVGILGLNGSGKSTMLQIVTSVLQPTTGAVQVNGKVAALLELGAGFNPELTGRDNVVLNGTIMGLSRDQIHARMEEIEAFADIGEFFDQPMKTYSSGMFMRVAFSTALYVDPEILIIDEALSVGDAKFQEKCFRRFKGFQDAGKTILFVTHDRSSVPRLCNLGILLHEGQLVDIGEPSRIVDLYSELLAFGHIRVKQEPLPLAVMPVSQASAAPAHAESQTVPQPPTPESAVPPWSADSLSPEDRCHLNPTYNKYEHRSGNGHAEIIDYRIYDGSKVNPTSISASARLTIDIKIRYDEDIQTPNLGLVFRNKEGVIIYGVNTEMMKEHLLPVKAGDVRSYRFAFSTVLCGGDWFIDFCIAESSASLCDYRCALAHLYVLEVQYQYVGLTRFQTEFCEAATFGAASPEGS